MGDNSKNPADGAKTAVSKQGLHQNSAEKNKSTPVLMKVEGGYDPKDDPELNRRRLVIMFVDENVIPNLFRLPEKGDWVRAGYARGLPVGCVVVSVNYSPERRGFLVTLKNESFAPVPIGGLVPELKQEYYAICVAKIEPLTERA